MAWISRIHADSCRTSPFHRLTCDNRSPRRSRERGRPHPEPAMRSPCSLGRVPTSVTTSSASCARPPAIIEDLHTIADLRDPDHGHLHSRGRGPNNDRWGTRLRQLRPTGGTPANAINLSGTEPPIAKRRLRGVMPCVQSSRSSTRSCSGPSLGPSPSGQDYVRSVDGSAARRRRCRSRCASRWGTPPSRHDWQYRR